MDSGSFVGPETGFAVFSDWCEDVLSQPDGFSDRSSRIRNIRECVPRVCQVFDDHED